MDDARKELPPSPDVEDDAPGNRESGAFNLVVERPLWLAPSPAAIGSERFLHCRHPKLRSLLELP